MGTAYCVDPKAGRILWRAVPDGAKAMGSNTSSPCVVQGRVYYGTTAGTLHVLDARNGETVKLDYRYNPRFADTSRNSYKMLPI